MPITLHYHAQLPTHENLNRNFQQDNYYHSFPIQINSWVCLHFSKNLFNPRKIIYRTLNCERITGTGNENSLPIMQMSKMTTNGFIKTACPNYLKIICTRTGNHCFISEPETSLLRTYTNCIEKGTHCVGIEHEFYFSQVGC